MSSGGISDRAIDPPGVVPTAGLSWSRSLPRGAPVPHSPESARLITSPRWDHENCLFRDTECVVMGWADADSTSSKKCGKSEGVYSSEQVSGIARRQSA
jgi:hypothetical protein